MKMKRDSLVYALLAVLLLFLLIPWPGTFLAFTVKHQQSGRNLLTFPFAFRHPFHISFTNSIYLAPVVEKFEIVGSTIHLREIVTDNWGVVEYYAIPGKIRKEGPMIHMQDLQFRTPKLTLMIGFIGKQRLIWEDRTYVLYALTEPGGILRLEAGPLPPWKYLWLKVHGISDAEKGR
jgi:hypothetical protein